MVSPSKTGLAAQVRALRKALASERSAKEGLESELSGALAQQTATAEILEVIRRSPADAQPVFDAIAGCAAPLFSPCDVSIHMIDGAQIALRAAAGPRFARRRIDRLAPLYPLWAEPEAGSLARVIAGKRVAEVPDTQAPGVNPRVAKIARAGKFRWILSVPLLREGEGIGAISLSHPLPRFRLSERQRALLQSFASQAAIAIENARRFNETKEALERQATTADILRVISASPTDIQPVFDAIVNSAARLVEPCNVVVMIRAGDRVRNAAIAGPRKHEVDIEKLNRELPIDELDVERSAVVRAIVENRTIEVPDTEAPEVSEFVRAVARSAGHRSVTSVPLDRKGTAIGAIVLTNPQAGFRLTEKQLAQVRTFADQAVIAIENVRLFKELEARNRDLAEALEQQTATAEILEVIASSPSNVQPVFEAILRNAMRLCDANLGAFGLYDGERYEHVMQRGANEEFVKWLLRGPFKPDPKAGVGRMLFERRPVHIPDLREAEGYRNRAEMSVKTVEVGGTRTFLAVPMLKEDRVLGGFVIYRREVQPFTQRQIDLVSTFASQAAIAIENVRLFNETKEALERQTATAEILRVIGSSITDAQPVFDAIVENCRALFKGSGVMLRLLQDGMLHARASVGYDGGAVPLDRESAVGVCVLEGRTIHLPDLEVAAETFPRIRQLGLKYGYRSGIYAPLLRGASAIGTIGVLRPEAGAFEDKEVALLDTFAGQAVIAIENVRLFNETREALEQQTAIGEVLRVISGSPTDVKPVLEAVAQRAARICEAPDAHIFLVDGNSLRHLAEVVGEVPAATPMGETMPLDRESVTGRAVVDRSVTHVRDILAVPPGELAALRAFAERTGFRTGLSVPLLREGHALGAISLRRFEVRPFTERQISLLGTFADQAAIAIENVRLFNETKEALERQTATAEILKVIAGSPSEVRPVFDAIANAAMRLIGGFSAAVTRVVDDQLHLEAFTSTNPSGDEALRRSFPRPIGEGLAGPAVKSGRPFIRRDTETDPDVTPEARERARARGYRSGVAVPLLREGVAIGTINVSRREPGEFSKYQVDLLQTFADQAVIAIENVRLFNETKDALERQTATAEILKVIASSPSDVQPVFDAIVRSGARLFAPWNVAILMLDEGFIHLRAVEGPGVVNLEEVAKLYPIPYDPAKSRAGRAISQSRIVEIPDVEAEADWALGAAIARTGGFRAATNVPLLRDGKGIGVISLTHPEPGRRLDPKQLALVQAFADQAVIAIENVRLFRELEARNKDLAETLEQQTATAEILRAISSSPSDVQPVFDAIVQNALRIVDGYSCVVNRIDGGLVHLAAYTSVHPEADHLLKEFFPIPIDPTNLMGSVVTTKSAQFAADLEAEPRASQHFRDIARARGYRSMLLVPMLRDDAVIGVIVVTRRKPGAFPDRYVGLLQTFADQAVIAIENVRLFNETKEALERQTATAEILKVIANSPSNVQPVFDAIVKGCLPLFGGMNVALFLRRGDLIDRVAFALSPGYEDEARDMFPTRLDAGGINARAIQTATLVQVADVMTEAWVSERTRSVARRMGFRCLMSAPLLRDGAAVGAIAVFRAEPTAFSPQQVELLRTFADQAVIAIENVRLFNETKEALERQTATAEILKVIASSPADVQPVFDAIVRSCQRLFGGQVVVLTLVEAGQIVHRAGVGSEDLKDLPQAWPLDRDSATGTCVLDGRKINIGDTLLVVDEFPRMKDLSIRLGYRAGLYVPLRREGGVIGTINIVRKAPGAFTEREVSLAGTFADQAVIAIENVRLFNETKEALERQTASAEILRVIAAARSDTRPVFAAILRSGLRLFSGMSVAISVMQRDELRVVAADGEFGAMPIGYLVPLTGESTTATAVSERRTVTIPDTEAAEVSQHTRDNGRRVGFRAVAAVPMLREGEAIGCISVMQKDAGGLTEHQLDLLRTFADQAVIAIENVRLFNETKEALERQTATAEILRVISSSPTDIQPVLDAVAERAARLCEASDAVVRRVDGDDLRIVAHFGDDPLTVAAHRISRGSVGGRAVLECRTVHVHDLGAPESRAEYPEAPALQYGTGHRTLLAVPLVRDGVATGIILIRRLEARPFSDTQINLLETFADQAVIAIENVRLFNETKEALERQTATAEILKVIASSPSDVQPVFQTIAKSALRLVGGHSATVVQRVGDELRLAALTATDREGDEALRRMYPARLTGRRAVGQALLRGQPVQVADLASDPSEEFRAMVGARGIRSMLAVPMVRDGQGIGAINVSRAESGSFSDHHVGLLRTFADQAVIAIENVRLFNETKEALERQTATAEILKVIASSPSDAQPVLDAVARSALRLIGGMSAIVTRVEGDTIHLWALTTTDPSANEAVRGHYPRRIASSTLAERMVALRAPDQVIDVETDPSVSDETRALARVRGWRSLLIVPLLREGELIGTINIVRPEPGLFAERQVNLIQTFASQAVIAIENVRLFKELQSRTEALTRSVGQLTALSEVGQAISSTLDLETVLKTIVSRAVQLTGLDAGVIYEYDEAGEAFQVRASENFDEASVAGLRTAQIRRGEGAIGRAVMTREPAQVPDTHHRDYPVRLRGLLDAQGFRAILAVPLVREEHVIGALMVIRRAPGEFAPETVELLKTFATQSALAIQNARLFREIAEKGRQLEVASRHKSDFLASMSHELRTPLNAILGFNEMILGEVYGEVPADMKEPLADIQTSGKHLLRLINNVLDLAKIEAGRMELALSDYSVQDTVESVRSTLRPLAADKGLEFAAEVPQDIPLGYGDPGRITQCLMNLAGNALKFTKQGRVEISVEQKDAMLLYRVADTGMGIPAEKIGNLFTEFKQTDATIASEYGGTGLGLSISKKFVEMHGGRIWVESEPGKGSTFLFEIPLRVGEVVQ